MPFSLTRVDHVGKAIAPPLRFGRDIKVGPEKSDDLVLSPTLDVAGRFSIVLHGLEYQLFPEGDGTVLINDAPLDAPPALLVHGDIIATGSDRFRFQVIHETIKRGVVAAMVSFVAIFLLAALIVFELLVMFWLPTRLNAEKAWEREAAQQQAEETLDLLRSSCVDIGKKFREPLDVAMIKPMKDSLDDIARYMRLYRESLTLEQVRALNEDMARIKPLVRKWKVKRKAYFKRQDLNVKTYLADMARQFESEIPLP